MLFLPRRVYRDYTFSFVSTSVSTTTAIFQGIASAINQYVNYQTMISNYHGR